MIWSAVTSLVWWEIATLSYIFAWKQCSPVCGGLTSSWDWFQFFHNFSGGIPWLSCMLLCSSCDVALLMLFFKEGQWLFVWILIETSKNQDKKFFVGYHQNSNQGRLHVQASCYNITSSRHHNSNTEHGNVFNPFRESEAFSGEIGKDLLDDWLLYTSSCFILHRRLNTKTIVKAGTEIRQVSRKATIEEVLRKSQI